MSDDKQGLVVPKSHPKYTALVWAGLVVDPPALAKEKARRAKEAEAAQTLAERRRDGAARPESLVDEPQSP